jgi:hypothetical protein
LVGFALLDIITDVCSCSSSSSTCSQCRRVAWNNKMEHRCRFLALVLPAQQFAISAKPASVLVMRLLQETLLRPQLQLQLR